MIFQKKAASLSIVICLFFIGCAERAKEEKETPKSAADETTANTPFKRATIGDTVLFISHTIKEYDTWKAAFDLAQSAREKKGIKTLNIYSKVSNPSSVIVYTEVTNLSKAKEYITSNKLQNAMQMAGVIGAMDLYWMATQLEYSKPITDPTLMFMSFKVISYDRWEKAFLQDFKDDPERDFQVRTVLKGVEDPGQVAMIFAVDDPNYVEKMEKDNTFRAKMLASGVISYPVTNRLVNMPL